MKKTFKEKLLHKLKSNRKEECPSNCDGVNISLIDCSHASLYQIFHTLNRNLLLDKYNRYWQLYSLSVPFSIVILLVENDLV